MSFRIEEAYRMAVTIKSEHEIALMRKSCRRLAVVHDEIGKMIRPGISTWELDKKAYENDEIQDLCS